MTIDTSCRFCYFLQLANAIYQWSEGRVNAKVDPLPPLPSELFLAHILPAWASIMLLEINKPNPIP